MWNIKQASNFCQWSHTRALSVQKLLSTRLKTLQLKIIRLFNFFTYKLC